MKQDRESVGAHYFEDKVKYLHRCNNLCSETISKGLYVTSMYM